ncbi:MAG: HAD family hydrolase [Bacteroidota bacterium]
MKNFHLLAAILIIGALVSCNSELNKDAVSQTTEIIDPLPSWNERNAKSAVFEYIEDVTNPESENFIQISDRIAVFDNDGTIWSEQPAYFQLFFTMDRVKALASEHPEWKEAQPFKAVLENNIDDLAKSGEHGLVELVLASHSGVTEAEFENIVEDWIKTAQHPTKKKPFTDFVYKPMLELLTYLQANDFKTYIVSGGGVDFMRPIISELYNIPSEQIIGSTLKSEYDYNDGSPVIRKLPEMDFVDDKEGKPININKIIGKKPVFAAGNSDGDLAMMQWTASNKLKNFNLYVHHTDSIREWAYDRDSHVGKLDKGLDQAREDGWLVVDMQNDWNTIFIKEN